MATPPLEPPASAIEPLFNSLAPYYDDGLVTIYHADCRDVLPHLGGRVRTTVTSPPYNTLTTHQTTGMHKTNGWFEKVRTKGYADDMTEADYWQWQSDVASSIASSTAPGGSLFYNHKLRYRAGQPIIPVDYVRTWTGWTLRQELVWARDGSMVFNARMFPCADERIYWMVRDGAAHQWNQADGNRWLSVWRMNPQTGIDGHPCPFPLALPSRCILATTNPGDLVLDPFMGSGTTLRAAKNLGRPAIGIDISERYCELAATRLAQGVLDLA